MTSARDGTGGLRPGTAVLVVLAVVLTFLFARWPSVSSRVITNINDHTTFGLFPAHLLSGLIATPQAYLPEPHQGCAILWGAPCAGVFSVLGPTAGALKWCSLLWQALMVGVFAWLALRVAGPRSAVLLGLLWALSPPTVVASASFGLPNHIDAGLLTAAFALALLAAHHSRGRGISLAVGLLAALSVYFVFDAVLVLAGLVGTYFLQHRRLPTRLKWLVSGAGLGLSPYLFGGGYWSEGRGREALLGVFGLGESPPSHSMLDRASELFGSGMPAALGFWEPIAVLGGRGPSLDAGIGMAIVGVAWSCAMLAGIQINGPARPWARMAVAAGLAHILGAVASGLPLFPFYLTPAVPWFLLASAFGLAGLWGKNPLGVGRLATVVLIGSLMLVASPGTVQRALESQPGNWTVTEDLAEALEARRPHRLLRHPLGYSRLTSLEAEELRGLAMSQAAHRDELLRILGRSLESELEPEDSAAPLWEARWDALMASGPSEGPARLYVALGAGSGYSEAFDSGGSTTSYLNAVESQLESMRSARGERDWPFEVGAWLQPASRISAVSEGGGLAGRRLSPSLCVAVGLHWVEAGVHAEWLLNLVERAECAASELGVGAAMGAAQAFSQAAFPALPPLTVWSEGRALPAEIEDAYSCAYPEFRKVVDSLRSDPWPMTASDDVTAAWTCVRTGPPASI